MQPNIHLLKVMIRLVLISPKSCSLTRRNWASILEANLPLWVLLHVVRSCREIVWSIFQCLFKTDYSPKKIMKRNPVGQIVSWSYRVELKFTQTCPSFTFHRKLKNLNSEKNYFDFINFCPLPSPSLSFMKNCYSILSQLVKQFNSTVPWPYLAV